MIVLKVIGAILGLLLLLFFVVLFLSVGIVLRVGSDRKFSFGVRVLGMEFGEESESNHPFVRLVQKLINRQKQAAPPPDEKPKTGGTDMLKQHMDMIFPLLERIFGVLRHCRISRCHVRYVSGGENAAVEYGEVCALVYPFVGHLQNRRRLRKRHTHLDIGWDYEAESAVYDLEIAVSVRVAVLVWAALRLLVQYSKRKGETR